MTRTFGDQAGDRHWVEHPLVLGDLAITVPEAAALEKEQLHTNWQAAGVLPRAKWLTRTAVSGQAKGSCSCSKVVQAGFGGAVWEPYP